MRCDLLSSSTLSLALLQPCLFFLQGPVHAVLPFPDPRRHHQDLAASQALQPVPGTLAASRALSGTVAGSLRLPQQAEHAQQAAGEEEQGGSPVDPDEPSSPGQSYAVGHCKG